MKKIILTLIIILLIFQQKIQGQSNPQEIPQIQQISLDTLHIQYLSKVNGQPIDFYAKSFVSELEKDSTIDFQLIFTKSGDKTRYLLKVSGQGRWNVLGIVRKYYHDAYYVDDRGWRLLFENN